MWEAVKLKSASAPSRPPYPSWINVDRELNINLEAFWINTLLHNNWYDIDTFDTPRPHASSWWKTYIKNFDKHWQWNIVCEIATDYDSSWELISSPWTINLTMYISDDIEDMSEVDKKRVIQLILECENDSKKTERISNNYSVTNYEQILTSENDIEWFIITVRVDADKSKKLVEWLEQILNG